MPHGKSSSATVTAESGEIHVTGEFPAPSLTGLFLLQHEPFTPLPNRSRARNDNPDETVSPVVLPTSEVCSTRLTVHADESDQVVGVGKWSLLPLMPEERTAAAVAVVWKIPSGFFYKPLVDLLAV